MVREGRALVDERVVQGLWYDRLFRQAGLLTTDGRELAVVSPGWWNHGPGPDFKGAQLEFNGRLHTGDVEIHLSAAGWRQHGHDKDSRYDEVILHVVLDAPPERPEVRSSGREIPTLHLSPYLEEDILSLAVQMDTGDYPNRVDGSFGRCAGVVEAYGPERLEPMIRLAGEWRMLFKAREIRERMDRMGPDQVVYEMLLYACGFSHFKHHFRALARQLPYDRARQLGGEDALLLEAAFLQLSGLLPNDLPEGCDGVPHFARMRGYRLNRLEGLQSLPLDWRRIGVRPINFPERRMAGAARVVARTADLGLVETVDRIWRQEDLTPLKRRRAFEALFPTPMGFWSSHCSWTGKKMGTPSALIGAGRVRSIIGNVFVPLGLALARKERNRDYEERVFTFFAALPKEPENQIQRKMLPRVYGDAIPKKINFCTQQGLLQMYADWCEPNPSCRDCRVMNVIGGKESDL